MSENFKQPLERPDRTLGDEWADWNGDNDKKVESGKGLFVFFTFLTVVVFDGVLFLLYYLTLPRLATFHHLIPVFVFWGIIIWAILTGILFLQLLLTVVTEKNFFFLKNSVFFVFDLVFTRVFKLAKLLRISRDRMGHSFILVSNSVVKAVQKNIKDKRLMILLPRCLTKDVIQQIYKLKEMYPIEIFTVSGGELARKKVKEYNPSAIIGVACERDLVSGIRDVGYRIPVIGIANRRPFGPCKDTVVDVSELTNAVEFYLK